ncbi:hypothetical protein EX30DRAFT_353119 [Ascodesmis nigricans]|uniref:Uncharacterized protein n=1 Tax=Ascodesmis nigricans TaxID=341454 RepID=A0A4S2N6F4_9PEZI|nr:hypothetical protein EX30DRAFT_353119 [Ascodesmis nigricans]
MYPTTPAGTQLDLNHLWQQVQELSALLAANREAASGLVRRADEIRNRSNTGDAAGILQAVNGHINAENETLRKDLADTKWENEELSVLVEDYSSVMAKVLEGLRVYALEHSQAMINIHSSYTKQLTAERATNAALRQQEADDKARLVAISTMLREAYSSETALEPDIEIEKLKTENRGLRKMLGLPSPPESEEDE